MRYVLTSDEIKSMGIVDEWAWEGKKKKFLLSKIKRQKRHNI